MAGSETFQQLISILIFTFLSNAAALMVSSMSDQYLFNRRPKSAETAKKKKKMTSHVRVRFTSGVLQNT